MGIISLEQTDRLVWLGRYIERVYTTLQLFFEQFDAMIEEDEDYYKKICKQLEIPDIYGSREVFLDRYLYDENDMNSITSNLTRAYDNAIVLREEIGSETLSYVQLAIYDMQKAKADDSPLVALQKVIDDIMAFWGMEDDSIGDEQTRNMVKLGKRIERIDLYARSYKDKQKIKNEVTRLSHRIGTTGIKYDENLFAQLLQEVTQDDVKYMEIVKQVENLLYL